MTDADISKLLKQARAFSGTAFRSVSIRHSKLQDITSGEGSFRNGGRWNPIGIRANYGSLTPECAMAETLASSRYFGLAAHTAMPRVFVAMQLQLSIVIDLTDAKKMSADKIPPFDMGKVDWRKDLSIGRVPKTQAFGRLAAMSGVEAIVVPSAALTGGSNIVVFVDNLKPSSKVEVLSSKDFSA